MEGSRVNATLTFGMVVIPVGVVPVVSSTDRVSFKRLHRTCEQPVKMPPFCPTCDKQDLSADEIVSGFEVSKGVYMVVSDEEKAAVAPDRSSMITISKFVSGGSTALMQAVRLGTDKSYWLPPQNEHVLLPYVVLANAMHDQQVVAIAKATVWSRQWPVCIEAIDGMLALTQLHPASAIRAGGLEWPEIPANQRSMAKTVVGEYTSELEPEDLVSDADDALKDMIAAKLAGKQYAAPELVEPKPTTDMLHTLKTMIAEAKKPKSKPTTKRKAKV